MYLEASTRNGTYTMSFVIAYLALAVVLSLKNILGHFILVRNVLYFFCFSTEDLIFFFLLSCAAKFMEAHRILITNVLYDRPSVRCIPAVGGRGVA